MTRREPGKHRKMLGDVTEAQLEEGPEQKGKEEMSKGGEEMERLVRKPANCYSRGGRCLSLWGKSLRARIPWKHPRYLKTDLLKKVPF